jgi:hypothetical protein
MRTPSSGGPTTGAAHRLSAADAWIVLVSDGWAKSKRGLHMLAPSRVAIETGAVRRATLKQEVTLCIHSIASVPVTWTDRPEMRNVK